MQPTHTPGLHPSCWAHRPLSLPPAKLLSFASSFLHPGDEHDLGDGEFPNLSEFGPAPHLVHSRAVHLTRGALLIPCTTCGTGSSWASGWRCSTA